VQAYLQLCVAPSLCVCVQIVGSSLFPSGQIIENPTTERKERAITTTTRIAPSTNCSPPTLHPGSYVELQAIAESGVACNFWALCLTALRPLSNPHATAPEEDDRLYLRWSISGDSLRGAGTRCSSLGDFFTFELFWKERSTF
jgi:hypothetical protein